MFWVEEQFNKLHSKIWFNGASGLLPFFKILYHMLRRLFSLEETNNFIAVRDFISTSYVNVAPYLIVGVLYLESVIIMW